jgi:hypothetical protein
MMKYALEHRIFYINSLDICKRNPVDRVKVGLAVSIVVFVLHLHQRFSDWWKKVCSAGSFVEKNHTRQNAVLTEAIKNNTGSSN